MARAITPAGDSGAPGVQGDHSPPTEELAFSREPKLRKGEARTLKERMNRSQKFYEEHFEQNASRCEELYEGFHWRAEKGRANDHNIVVNYLLHVVETIVGSITFSNPRVTLEPESPEGLTNQDRSERAANYAYRKGNAHRETRRSFKESWIYGFGVLICHWLFETEDEPEIEGRPPVSGEPPDPDAVLAAVERGEDLPLPVDPPRILHDYPCAKRLDPRQFRVPPEADWVLEDMPWCGYVEVRPLDEVKADPRFRKGIANRLKGTETSQYAYLSDSYRGKDADGNEITPPSDVKRVKLSHYFEKRRKIHVVFAEEEETPLLVEKWYWKHGRYPFRLIFAPGLLEHQFYHRLPPLMQWEHMQSEINLVRSDLATHRRRYKRGYLVQAGALSKNSEDQLQNGEDGRVIILNAAHQPSEVQPLQDMNLNQAVYDSDQIAKADLDALSGTSGFERGSSPTKRLTTTEVNAIEGAGSSKQKTIAQNYEEFVAGTAEDLFDLLQQFTTRMMTLPIYNEQDKVAGFDPVSTEEIQGDYRFTTWVGSTQQPHREGLIEQIGFLFQALQPYAQAGVINIKPLIEQLLSLMPEIKDVAAIVGTDQAPPGMGGEQMDPSMMMGLPGPGGAPPPPGMEGMGGGPAPGQIPDDLLAQLGVGGML